ncbi:MAG: hypothetical protein ACPGVK_05850, partial [Halocynthiibacter sp.]
MSGLKLQDFGRSISPAQPELASKMGEAQRLEQYEEGYKAGWADAAKAGEDDQQKIKADFGRNLSELSFTFRDAQHAILRSQEPLFREIIERVLPLISKSTLVEQIASKLSDIAKEQSKEVVLVFRPVYSLFKV